MGVRMLNKNKTISPTDLRGKPQEDSWAKVAQSAIQKLSFLM